MIVQFETKDWIVEADLHWSALARVISKFTKGVGGITFQTQRNIDKPPSAVELLLKRKYDYKKAPHNVQ